MVQQILIIDDDPAIRTSLNLLLKREGYTIFTSADPEEALKLLPRITNGLILMDMNYSRATAGEEGLALLKDIRTHTGFPIMKKQPETNATMTWPGWTPPCMCPSSI